MVCQNKSKILCTRTAIYIVCMCDVESSQPKSRFPAPRGGATATTAARSLRIENVSIRAVEPPPKVPIVLQRHELVAQAVSESQGKHVPAKTSLNLVHELCVGDFGVHADSDEVVRDTVKDLDLQERGIRVRRRDWGVVCRVRR